MRRSERLQKKNDALVQQVLSIIDNGNDSEPDDLITKDDSICVENDFLSTDE